LLQQKQSQVAQTTKRTDPKDIKLDDASCIAVLRDHNGSDGGLSWNPEFSDSITDIS